MNVSSTSRAPIRNLTRPASALATLALLAGVFLQPSSSLRAQEPGAATSASASASPSLGSASPVLLSPGAAPQSATPGPSSTAAPAADAEQVRIKEILAKAGSVNKDLKDYTAAMQIDLTVKMGILKLPVTLEGQYYYKAPDRVKMELRKAPAILSKYPQIFGQRPLRPEDHRITLLPDEELRGRKVWVLRFEKKEDVTDFRGQTVWIDQERYTQLRHVYSYRDNGKIAVDMIWRGQDAYQVLFEVTADLDFPKHGASATATAHYQDYRINTGLEDVVFDGKPPTPR